MARDFNIAVDVRPVERGLREFARQIPFAVSYAMNLTARNAVEYMRSDIQRIFTIRNNWEALGITFKPASKRDLTLEIGSRHHYMAAQVLGGTKEGKGGGTVGIPKVGRGDPRTTLQSKTPPSKWPKALVAKSVGTFIGTVQTKRGPLYGVWRRVNRSGETGKITRGKGKNTRLGLRLLYELAEKVNIKARWPMDRQVEAIWAGRWPTNAAEAVAYAIRTAREKT
jgi:hypothetical protein